MSGEALKAFAKQIQEGAAPNRLDRAISKLSPSWGLRRLQSRMSLAALGGTSWTGAGTDRPGLQLWAPQAQSSNDEQRFERPYLVSRAADLERNDPLAGGAIEEMVLSVVATGLSVLPEPNARILGWTQDQVVEWSEDTKQRFNLWAQNSRECDIARKRNFYQATALVYRTVQSRGDAFAILPRRKHAGGTWNLKFQLIEGDRCCNPRGKKDTDRLSQGVEVDPTTGAVEGYHFCSKHPSLAASADWSFRKAWSPDGQPWVLHLMHESRIDLRRGYPLLAPVIQQLKQMSQLSESELAASVVTSFLAVIIKKTGPGPGPLGARKKDGRGNSFSELGPAMVAELDPGEDIHNVTPTRPNGAFDPFWRSLMGQVAMRIQIPPEVLLKKFESSYTAARAALLQFWKFVTVERENLLVPNWCQPIYEAWLAEAVAIGAVKAPGFFARPDLRAAYCNASWIGDNAPILDPLKEVLAAEELVDYGFSTHAKQTLRLDGGDFESNHQQLTREFRMRREAGLLPDQAVQPVEPSEPDSDEPIPPSKGRRAALIALAQKDTP